MNAKPQSFTATASNNGTKLLLVPGENGKVDLAAVAHAVHRRTDIHYPKPRVLSVSQATELGTVCRPEELKVMGEAYRTLGLHLHMDGARFANALATTGADPADLSWRAGVDVLSFGGAKSSMVVGEAVVFFDRQLAEEFDYRCKQAGQLASKMRFLAAPWLGLLRNGALLRHAAHTNAMPPVLLNGLRERGWHFYTFIGTGQARFMCSWDTREADIADLAADLRDLANVSPKIP